MVRPGWLPPVSPYGLIQESLFPDEWSILVAAMLLNCTGRRQVERVLPELRRRWPGPQELIQAPTRDLAELCQPLGFVVRRTANIVVMSEAFLAGSWDDASELPGIGDYGARSWRIFCRGELGQDPPKDHALTRYWHWAVINAARVEQRT